MGRYLWPTTSLTLLSVYTESLSESRKRCSHVAMKFWSMSTSIILPQWTGIPSHLWPMLYKGLKHYIEEKWVDDETVLSW